MVGHLLQQTLRCLCTDSDWVYAVFWRILPRNYPPPKWDSESNVFDRSKGNKRNWILVWEDGFCDFVSCANSMLVDAEASNYGVNNDNPNIYRNYMQPELFFKMSHEVYNFGEGLMGKVAADSSHKWVYKDPVDIDPHYSSTWQGALDPHPRTWEAQFKSGIETIAVVAVKEGLVQLGSLKKANEDLNFVLSLQRRFNYLHSIPGVYAVHPTLIQAAAATFSHKNGINRGIKLDHRQQVRHHVTLDPEDIDEHHYSLTSRCHSSPFLVTSDYNYNIIPTINTHPITPSPPSPPTPPSNHIHHHISSPDHLLLSDPASSLHDLPTSTLLQAYSLQSLLSRLPSVTSPSYITNDVDSTSSSSTTFDHQMHSQFHSHHE